MRSLRAVIIAIVCGAGVASAQPAPPVAGAAVVRARVTGRVLDAAGAPVRGASVSVEGEAGAVASDALGRFELAAAPIGATLVVLKDGFAPGLAAIAPGTTDGPGAASGTAGAIPDIVLIAEAAGETIAVRGEAPAPPTHGAARLSRRELQRLPGTGNDL